MHDPRDPCIRPQRHILVLANHGQQRVRRLRFRADHASEALAESAIGAPRADHTVRVRVALADIGRRHRIGVIAKRSRRFANHLGKVRNLQRRRRIFRAPRTFKRVAAIHPLATQISSLARKSQHQIDARIVRLKIVVGDAPILDRMIRR